MVVCNRIAERRYPVMLHDGRPVYCPLYAVNDYGLSPLRKVNERNHFYPFPFAVF